MPFFIDFISNSVRNARPVAIGLSSGSVTMTSSMGRISGSQERTNWLKAFLPSETNGTASAMTETLMNGAGTAATILLAPSILRV